MRYAPRVKETTTTTGTGTYSLAGAETGFQRFVAGITSGQQTWYCCTDDTDWEIGVGTVTDSTPDTLSRDSVLYSSNSGSAVDWGSGSKGIFCIFPPNQLIGIDGGWESFNISHLNTITTDGDDILNIAIGNINEVAGEGNVAIGQGNIITTNSNYVIATGVGSGSVDNSGNPSFIYQSGYKSHPGDSQLKIFTCCTETTDGSESGMGYFILSGATINTGTALFEISVLARQTGGSSGTVGDSKSWKMDCMVTFVSGVLAQVGATVSSVIGASTGASAWTCSIDVSDNGTTGPIRLTGEANKTIHWVGFVRQIENSGGITT